MSEVLSDQRVKSSENGALTSPKKIRINCPMFQHSDFINKLGKPQEVAERISAESGKTIGRESVYKWRKHGVPWGWQPFMAKLAIQKGVSIPDDFVGTWAA